MMGLFKGYYDSHLCCCLADEYQTCSNGDRELLDELLRQLAPLAGIVAKLEMGRHLVGTSIDSLCCDALEKAYKLFEDGEVPTDSARVFTSFMYTSMKRAMIDSLRESNTEIFDYGYQCKEPPLGELPTHRNVDSRLQLEQIKDIVRAIFAHDCRYVGKELCACKFMALCELGLLRADPMTAQYKFRLTRSKAKILHQYTKILVKTSLYAVKKY
jgi:DNA-directed RNA polymerase specialized sigma24 family protein